MQKYFVRFPSGVSNVEGANRFRLIERSMVAHHAIADDRVLIASLTDEDKNRLQEAGARVYSDVQFYPAGEAYLESMPSSLQFWDNVKPAGNNPWDGLSQSDALGSIHVPEAWDVTKGAGVTIVIVDSGVNGSAPEFPLARQSAESFSLSYPDGPWVDKLGHGSMMAAIAAGSGPPGGRFAGVAPEATILAARTNYRATDLYAIYDRLISKFGNGAIATPIVVNNSYAAGRCNASDELRRDHPYAEMCAKVVEAGITMVFAAGNNHADMLCGNAAAACGPSTIWGVNSMDEILSIGAVNWDRVNTVGAHANSSRGAGEWANITTKPDLVAPSFGQALWRDGYQAWEWWGTSGSAAVVSGTVALGLAAAHGCGRQLTPAEIAAQLRATCDGLAGGKLCVGAGLVNARRFVDWARTP